MGTLDVPYNLRGNKDEAILDAMREIETLRQELDEEIMLRITLQKMNQKLVDDKKAWKSLNKYTEEE